MQVLLDVILPVFIVISLGYVTVWGGLFTSNNIDSLMKFSQSFAIPFLLFKGITEINLEESFQQKMDRRPSNKAVAELFVRHA